MEHHVTSTCEESLNLSTNLTDSPLSPQTLASIRSLIINPNTSNSTLSSLLETLTRSLQLSHDPLSLKLLADLAIHHPHLSSLVFDSVRSHSLSAESTRLAAESLDALASISDRNRDLIPAINELLDDQFFVSLCFGPSVSVRSWLLRNAERLGVRPYLLLTVFLGFTNDPYPYVRKVALDGLVSLCKSGVCGLEDRELIEGCYCRAVELLLDNEDYVRRAAVRVVSEWGRMLVESNQKESKSDWSNAVFIQLCSMVRDMNMEVRLEAFDALGMIGMVSEDVLLQTLSKKVLGITKEKKSHGQCAAEWFEISALSAAGAFVHGLEDEFHEVRKSACNALRTLTILSAKFAGEALNLLMDMLNDDSVAVRSQALETMHHMATCKHLKVQEIHMHRFLGSLFDNNAFIRSTARKILKLVKLPNLKLFKLSVDGLLESLEMYPQDEADIFSVLFYIGQNHGKFVAYIIKEVFQEIEPDTEGKLSFDSARVAAFLVLAISVPLSHKQSVHCIPPTVFSYAVTLLGRISHALSDVMNQNTLLAYFSQCSRSPSFSGTELKGEDPFLPVVKGDVTNFTSTEISSPVGTPLQQTCDEASEVQSQTWQGLREVATLHAEYLLEEHDEARKSMNLILAKVKDIWPLVQSGCTSEVLRTLRACKEEVATFTTESLESGTLAFTLQYLRVIKLLAKVWEHFVSNMKLRFYEMGELELLLGKLEKRLREMRCRFMGLSKEEELHVLELILVTYLLRLSRVEICCYLTTMKKLSAIISRVESLCEGGSVEPSNFLFEVSKSLHEIGTCTGGAYCRPFLFKKLLDFFSFKQFVLCRSLRHVNAELEVPGNNSENPLPFISGLPVAIPLNITLHNILSENRLWLRITMGEESTQFVFLDLNVLGGCNGVRTFTFIAPFYRTPKAVSFILRVCIGMECLFEDIQLVKGCGGPKHVLMYICQEKEVHLSKLLED